MRLFDSHCHLDDEQFEGDLEKVLARMLARDVVLCVDPGSDISSSRRAIARANADRHIYAAAGVHPHEAGKAAEDYLETLAGLLQQPRVVALGEIGLDYHYDFSPRDVQKRVMDEQVRLALEMDKPVIFHIREAHGDMVDYFRSLPRCPRGIIHCFSGSAETAREYVRMGFMISFAGPVTFKNAARLREALHAVPPERLLIETDSPYMAPEPVRGQRNEPANVYYVMLRIAQEMQMDAEELSRITFENACRFYGIRDV